MSVIITLLWRLQKKTLTCVTFQSEKYSVVAKFLKQTGTDGYLICDLFEENKHKNRGKGISQKFMRHKLDLGFWKKEKSFHILCLTLAIRFQSKGVEELHEARN